MYGSQRGSLKRCLLKPRGCFPIAKKRLEELGLLPPTGFWFWNQRFMMWTQGPCDSQQSLGTCQTNKPWILRALGPVPANRQTMLIAGNPQLTDAFYEPLLGVDSWSNGCQGQRGGTPQQGNGEQVLGTGAAIHLLCLAGFYLLNCAGWTTYGTEAGFVLFRCTPNIYQGLG